MVPRCELYMLIKIHSKRDLGDGSWQILRQFRRAIWGRTIVLLQGSEVMVYLRGQEKAASGAHGQDGVGFSMPVEGA